MVRALASSLVYLFTHLAPSISVPILTPESISERILGLESISVPILIPECISAPSDPRVYLCAHPSGPRVGALMFFSNELALSPPHSRAYHRTRSWTNVSGTYRAEDTMCYQTGLPLDKFWALHGGQANAHEAERFHTYQLY